MSSKNRKEQILMVSHVATWWKDWQALSSILQTGNTLTNDMLSWQHCYRNSNIRVVQKQLSNTFAHGVWKMLSHYFSGTPAASILMSLPKQPRNDHPVSIQTYKKEQWTLVIANIGAKDPADYQTLYCNYWQTHLIPCLIQEFKGSLGETHLWIPSLQTGMLWKYLRSIWTMLVPSYHGILGPKQDWILTSSSGTSQNILKHHIYILWLQNYLVKSWKGNLLFPHHYLRPKHWH